MRTGLLKRHPGMILRPDAPLRAAMAAMTRHKVGLVLVADARRRLLGVLNDTDLRRALLAGATLASPVERAMNRRPIVLRADAPAAQTARLFRRTGHANIPIVDARGRLVELANVLDHAAFPRRFPNRVVLMAGGRGRRLRPLTARTPKPMLKVGGKPLLEHLIEQLAAAGFSRFILAVNYLAGQIQSHFGDGSRWGVEIGYLREPRPLGTVGALGLLRERPEEPLLVMNGDVLAKVDFGALLDFHAAEKALATVCVKSHEIQIPYGVVETDGRRLSRFLEKPAHRFLVNAGVYVLDPRALALIPRSRPFDMPDLLAAVRRRTGVACFTVEDYWLDVGGLPELRRAEGEFGKIFGA